MTFTFLWRVFGLLTIKSSSHTVLYSGSQGQILPLGETCGSFRNDANSEIHEKPPKIQRCKCAASEKMLLKAEQTANKLQIQIRIDTQIQKS